jgi:NAD(P)-dependent dehydrogenase (short-subunit alcohol dehydrogenase family)
MTTPEDSPFHLGGLRVVVSGAAGGIGGATAILLAKLGARLELLDVAGPQAIAARVGDLANARLHVCDVSDRRAVERLAVSIGPVDALVDAGAVNPFDDWEAPDWDDSFDRVLAVNARGPINLVRAFSPGMLERRNGRIVLIGSFAGRAGGLRNGPHYAVSKGGVHALTRWYAKRFAAHNVLVNAIAPGATDTPMIAGQGFDASALPMGRFARPEEQAAAIAFLCSPAASYITGVILDVNGGLHFG